MTFVMAAPAGVVKKYQYFQGHSQLMKIKNNG